MNAAELTAVTATYGESEALSDLSLHLSEGESVALLGPNGAGKTTAIRLLIGLKRVQTGKAFLFGKDPRSPHARRRIGVTPQDTSFPINLRVGEILDFTRIHFPAPKPRHEIIEAFGLGSLLRRNATRLSGGQQRNLAVSLAFCGDPDVVFLDEPTTGLDIRTRRKIWDYIHTYTTEGGSLFLTTHYIEEAEAIADRIILLANGRIVAAGSVSEIKDRVNVRVLNFSSDTKPALTSATLTAAAGGRYTFLSSDADETVREIITSGCSFRNLEVLPASLEQAIGEILDERQ